MPLIVLALATACCTVPILASVIGFCYCVKKTLDYLSSAESA